MEQLSFIGALLVTKVERYTCRKILFLFAVFETRPRPEVLDRVICKRLGELLARLQLDANSFEQLVCVCATEAGFTKILGLLFCVI